MAAIWNLVGAINSKNLTGKQQNPIAKQSALWYNRVLLIQGNDMNQPAPRSNDMAEDAYAAEVQRIMALLDQRQQINPEFISTAYDDGLDVFQAISDWFSDEPIAFKPSLHISGQSRLLDVTVQGIGTIRRAVFSQDIEATDPFNTYYGDSSKGGAWWRGDLTLSLRSFMDFIDAEQTDPE